jgi:hypothetical protein
VARPSSRAQKRRWVAMPTAASADTRSRPEPLLSVVDESHHSPFDRLRKGPYRRSVPELGQREGSCDGAQENCASAIRMAS